MAGVAGRDWSTAASEPIDSQTLAGVRRFSAALLAKAIANKGNVLVSPASVFLALAMTMNGADKDTRVAMLKTLAGQGINADLVNRSSRALMASLARSSGKTTVSIANAIWFRDGFRPNLAFLQANADYYRASAVRLDFADPAAPGIINGWVNDRTHGLIKTLVNQISPTTVMFLVNTLYFKSDWQSPFEKAETRPAAFQAPSGAVTAEFMHQTAKLRYFSGEAGGKHGGPVTGIALPYDDGQFTYFALQTEPGISPREWLASQDEASLFDTLSGLMAQKANFTVSLALPKYEAAFDDSLVDDLTALGMGVAFDGARADFSLLNETPAKGLFISEVRHKTFIKVDEKGTEAAAATSVAIDESMPAYDRELVFDRPFIYGILDTKTGMPLFAGILENPAAK